MASLLTDPLFEISGQAPPPNKNFYYFAVTKSSVIWRWWKISLRSVDRYSKPGELKESHQDFLDDIQLQSEVRGVFGPHIFQYSKALCEGCYDYLARLPAPLILRIMNYLELEDVGRLGQTSRRFRQLCRSEEFWEQAVRRHCFTVSDKVAALALEVGWFSIFFTSKLQLQKLISRQRKTEGQKGGPVSDPDMMKKPPPDESSGTNQASGSKHKSYPGVSSVLNLGTNTAFDLHTSSDPDIKP